MHIHYLEIVTNDVESVCALHARVHGVTFAEANPILGGARTARLPSGSLLGIRAPLHGGERPVVRPYVLVPDIAAAVSAAVELGAEVAVPPMLLPGYGLCAIYFLGGNEFGLWQV